MKRSIEWAGEALQALEFIACVCFATALVAIGPVIWCHRLFTAGRFAWGCIVAILWLCSVVTIALEVRRKALTLISLGIFLTWLVVLFWVFNDWFL